MKILFVSSEAGPFVRTGGLGDVIGSLPKTLSQLGEEVGVVLPLYEEISADFRNKMEFIGSLVVPLGWRQQYGGLFKLEWENVSFFFVDNEYYFKRKGLYGHFDDGERFAFFSKAALELLPLMSFGKKQTPPDIIHCNDWQTGLVPVMLDSFYRDIDYYKHIKTVMAIHNIEFQGEMDKYVIDNVFGIPASHTSIVEYKGNANMLKAGIESANKVVTVSPTYANEIKDPFFAHGLEDIIRARSFKISGILNGIDVDLYNPEKDKALFAKFSAKNPQKKAVNKKELQKLFNLPQKANVPLIGMVTRLTSQKGIDLVIRVIHDILSLDLQLVVLGTGDWKYENALNDIVSQYPTKMASAIYFSADVASKIYGGADMFLMPSKFEPCGLSQMMSMRYGTIPIVRETGGLKDSVTPFNPETKKGDGFTFLTYNAYDMLDAIKRAVGTFANKEEWSALMKNVMAKDWSWERSAKEYIALYKSM
ncbi:MAG TPA: glycogen synthase GlgA [Clostridiales bacterium]|nr:glycogen synthase GlgA [Clostridiales bacterium]